MKAHTFTLETISPCFCGGAEPKELAEIRAPSIRGQLRWWFRTLGGFKNLDGQTIREQEQQIFGSIAGTTGLAGKLAVRILPRASRPAVVDCQGLGYRQFSDESYLTFPIQSRQEFNGRGVLLTGSSFELTAIWRGDRRLDESINALISVFAHIGSLGFRGRRAMGALGFCNSGNPNALSLQDALAHFGRPQDLQIRCLRATTADGVISSLGAWLRQWRAHGRTQDHRLNRGDHTKPPLNKGFGYAKRNHDLGYGLQDSRNLPAYRPPLGLPIIQRTGRGTNTWNWGPGRNQGRFASPVLLRPYRTLTGQWLPLVIFANAHRWPAGHGVHQRMAAGGRGQAQEVEHAVSLDLYDAMRNDPDLRPLAAEILRAKPVA